MFVAQVLSRSGNFSFNIAQFHNVLSKFEKNNLDLLIFPSHFITGIGFRDYHPRLYSKEKYLSHVAEMIEKTRPIDAKILIGTDLHEGHEGNHILLISQGKILDVFTENDGLVDLSDLKKKKIFTINDGRRVLVLFFKEVASANISVDFLKDIDVCLVFMDEPYYHGCIEDRIQTLEKYQKVTDILALNSFGLAGEKLYDGTVLFLKKDADHEIFVSSPFKEDLYNLNEISSQDNNDFASLDYEALLFGIREFSELNGRRSYVIGLSGGIDSAVVAALAVKAVGTQKVKALIMPSQFTSTTSLEDAFSVAKNLEIEYELVSIQKVYEVFRNERQIHISEPSLADENLQARLRMLFLMYEANSENSLMLNTSNKSEILTGYGTLYGDAAGALSVLGDVYKTEVYKLATLINQDKPIIPDRILTKEPSAELRQNQKDSDSLPPYPLLDPILIDIVENEMDYEALLTRYDTTIVNRVLHLLYSSVFKLYQLPPKLILCKSSLKITKNIFYPSECLL